MQLSPCQLAAMSAETCGAGVLLARAPGHSLGSFMAVPSDVIATLKLLVIGDSGVGKSRYSPRPRCRVVAAPAVPPRPARLCLRWNCAAAPRARAGGHAVCPSWAGSAFVGGVCCYCSHGVDAQRGARRQRGWLRTPWPYPHYPPPAAHFVPQSSHAICPRQVRRRPGANHRCAPLLPCCGTRGVPRLLRRHPPSTRTHPRRFSCAARAGAPAAANASRLCWCRSREQLTRQMACEPPQHGCACPPRLFSKCVCARPLLASPAPALYPPNPAHACIRKLRAAGTPGSPRR